MKARFFNIIQILTISLLLPFGKLTGQDLCIPVGWATQNGGTTGGGNASPVTVTTLSALQTEVNSSAAKVIYVSGTIGNGVSTRINVKANKTIIGLPGATILGGFDLNAGNIIIRNLKIYGPGSVDVNGVDCITIEGDAATHIWIDHCELYDGQDGNLDISNGADLVSITWCKFGYTANSQNHQFCNLIGSSDTRYTDRGKLRVTFMYNRWAEGCAERMPRVRFGQVHVVNNLFDSPQASYCVRAGFEANILVESNYFDHVRNPIDLFNNDFTAVTALNNYLDGATGTSSGSGTAFTPPYSLETSPASLVKAIVSSATCGAGAIMPSPNECPCLGIYALTTAVSPVGTGSISRAPDFSLYAPGSSVSLTANAISGYYFVNWLGTDSLATSNPVSVVMNSNRTITANFAPITAPVLIADTIQPYYPFSSSSRLLIPAGSSKTAYVGAVINDPTDPFATVGIRFTAMGFNPSLQVTSSNSAVINPAQINIIQTGNQFVLRGSPAGIGYATLTVKATNSAGSSSSYTIKLAVSAASAFPGQTTFFSGTSDGSAAAETDSNWMFVADDEDNLIRLYNRNLSGQPVYSFDAGTAVGASAECDFEGASLSKKFNPGRRIYWIGSLGNNKDGVLKADRNVVIATNIQDTGSAATLSMQSYHKGFRNSLITWGNNLGWNFTASAASGIAPKRIDGFNVEGLTVCTGGDTAYIGFRAPLVPVSGVTPTASNRKYAVLAPVTNFETLMNGSGLVTGSISTGAPILFDLEGNSIRSIERIGNGSYLITAGLYTGGGTPAVYMWNGIVPANSGQTPISVNSSGATLIKLNLSGLSQLAQISSNGDAEGHPEGMLARINGNQLQIDLISDNGTVDFYNDGTEAKSLPNAPHKKFRNDRFNWSLDSTVLLQLSYLGTGSGEVTLNPPGGSYPFGSTVQLTATATNGRFDGWTGDINSSSNPVSILMDGNKSVNAIFTLSNPRKKVAYVTDPAGATYVNDTRILPALRADSNLLITEINATATGIDYSSYDAVIFSEIPNSTAAGVAALEGINKPFLMMKVHSYKNATGAWNWTSSSTAYGQNATETTIVVANKYHPIFTGVNFVNTSEVALLSTVLSSKGLTYMDPAAFTSPSGGLPQNVAQVKNNAAQSCILQIPAGTTIGGTLIPKDFIQIGLNGASYTQVTNDGVRVVLNAVYYLLKLPLNPQVELCPGNGNFQLPADISGASYQWYWDSTGTSFNFLPVTDNAMFSGAQTSTLSVTNFPGRLTGTKLRVQAGGNNGNDYTIRFVANWQGTADTLWSNPANWECNILPDRYTDVRIKKNAAQLNQPAAVRTLQVQQPGKLEVAAPFNLIIYE